MSSPVAGALAVTPLYATAADAIVSWDDSGATWRSLAYLAAPGTLTLTGDVTGSGTTTIATSVVRLQGRPLAATAPGTNQVIQWSGTQWQPGTIAGGTGTVTSIASGAGITVSPSPIVGAGTVSLTVPVSVANGGTGTTSAFTAGSVVFAGASGVYAQDNANLFWDDTNNRLGIGTATPGSRLHVVGVSRAGGEATYRGDLVIDQTASDGTTGGIELKSDPGGAGWGSRIVNLYDAVNNAYSLIFQNRASAAGWTTRMVINAGSGNVGIGTAAPAVALDIGNATAMPVVRINGGTGTSQGSQINMAAGGTTYGAIANYSAIFGGAYNGSLTLYSPGTIALMHGANVGIGTVSATRTLTVNGDYYGANITLTVKGYQPGGGVWADSSDIRTKDIESIIDYERGLDAVIQLRPVSFRKNGRGGTIKDGKTYVGLVANEAMLVMPEMVGVIEEKLDAEDARATEILTLDATALIYALVNCTKTLAARVAALEKPL